MTPEREVRIKGGEINATLDGNSVVKIVFSEGSMSIDSKKIDSKKGLKRKMPVPPPGTVESLSPIIREAFSLYGVEQDEEYWATKTENSPYEVGEALRKLRRAGFSIEKIAELLVESEPKIHESLAHQDLNQDNINVIKSAIITSIKKQYPGFKKR